MTLEALAAAVRAVRKRDNESFMIVQDSVEIGYVFGRHQLFLEFVRLVTQQPFIFFFYSSQPVIHPISPL